ncbi:hypothetical protein NP493_1248g02059 [Ridgeia piscesae]|uniref:Uncharacterized protein n=1 Tax=Ridgeia piscesae TaxID=27915 RepID=A0AAD9KB83_RIDPI|nr:hypothetical protein NP493_1248g02059 [Ridgeia piscesae]
MLCAIEHHFIAVFPASSCRCQRTLPPCHGYQRSRVKRHPLAPSRSPFNSHRNAASPKPVAVLHLRLRYRKSGMPRDVTITDEPNLSAATSRIHTSAGAATIAVQLASKRDIAKALQGQQGEFGATRVLLSNKRASDVTAATAGISNSASYVLSVSCLFLCGPLRRISVNARFYVQCCLVL